MAIAPCSMVTNGAVRFALCTHQCKTSLWSPYHSYSLMPKAALRLKWDMYFTRKGCCWRWGMISCASLALDLESESWVDSPRSRIRDMIQMKAWFWRDWEKPKKLQQGLDEDVHLTSAWWSVGRGSYRTWVDPSVGLERGIVTSLQLFRPLPCPSLGNYCTQCISKAFLGKVVPMDKECF